MTEQVPEKVPAEIKLHSKSRLLVVVFSDGRRFELPCEYLRVFSRAKEVRTLGTPVTGKEDVNITRIEPQGQYAVRLLFDDGHDTGIYSWDTLYQLGERQSENWRGYLEKLAALGYSRKPAVESGNGPRKIRLLYFTYLVKKLRKESEELDIPSSVTDVQSLIGWLGKRRREHAHLFDLEHIQVTVNKQFTEPFTRVEDGDEVALIPRSPVAPVPK
jgi:DUF971 family protein/molybdopterin converting factor small subunit